jgi:hypothetical protein
MPLILISKNPEIWHIKTLKPQIPETFKPRKLYLKKIVQILKFLSLKTSKLEPEP